MAHEGQADRTLGPTLDLAKAPIYELGEGLAAVRERRRFSSGRLEAVDDHIYQAGMEN